MGVQFFSYVKGLVLVACLALMGMVSQASAATLTFDTGFQNGQALNGMTIGGLTWKAEGSEQYQGTEYNAIVWNKTIDLFDENDPNPTPAQPARAFFMHSASDWLVSVGQYGLSITAATPGDKFNFDGASFTNAHWASNGHYYEDTIVHLEGYANNELVSSARFVMGTLIPAWDFSAEAGTFQGLDKLYIHSELVGSTERFAINSLSYTPIVPTSNPEPSPVPEPSTALLLGAGLLGLGALGRRKN